MSINEEINRIENNISNAYDVMEEAGAEMPKLRNSVNLTATVVSAVENSSGKAYRKLDEKTYAEVKASGTYEGKPVEEGEIFTTYKGTFEKVHVLENTILDENSLKTVTFPIEEGKASKGQGFACTNGEVFISAYPTEGGLNVGISTDLKTWEWHLQEGITNTQYRSCIYAKGIFISGPYMGNGVIYSADNGKTWQIIEDLPTSHMTEAGIIFCHDKFYSVQTNGTSYYSEDGINWNTYTSSITGLNSGGMVYDGTNYVCATAGYIEYSSDGINWTSTSLPDNGRCSCIAATEVAIVIGDYSNYKIYYSTDHGVTWNTAALTDPPNYIGLYGVTNGSAFLMGTGSSTEQSLLYSADGINWTNTDYIVPGSGLVGTTAGFIGNGFVSDNGTTIRRFDGSFSYRNGFKFEDNEKVCVFSYRRMTCMNKNKATLSELSYSADEITSNYVEKLNTKTEAVLLENGTFNGETVENGSAFIDSQNRNCLFLKYENSTTTNPLYMPAGNVAYGNGIYVSWPSSGTIANTWHPAYSLDGITWYNCDITTNLASVIIFDGTKFVALAYDENGNKNCTYSSTDGMHWTQNALISSGTYMWWNSLAYKNGVFVCGNGSTGNNSIAYSSNLSTWNTVSIGTTSYCYAYANSNVFVVAIEKSTTYKYSTNGSSWSTGTLPGTYSSMQAAGDYIYLIDSNSNWYYTSNGTSWSSFTPPTSGGNIYKRGSKYYWCKNGCNEIYESTNGLTGWTLKYSSDYSIYYNYYISENNFISPTILIDFNKTNSYELYYTESSTLDKYPGYDTTKTQFLKNDKGSIKWGKAVQTIESGSANGTISVDSTDVAVKGLGTAAYTASSAYATSAQGSKADTALQNAATGSNSLAIGGTSNASNSLAVGKSSSASGNYATAIGEYAVASGGQATAIGSANGSFPTNATGLNSIAIGGFAHATAEKAIQLGLGTNNTANTFNVFDMQLLNSSGIIPVARLGATSNDTTKFLRGDGTWQPVSGGGLSETYSSGIGMTISPTGVNGYIGQNSTYSDGILTTTSTGKAGLLLPDTINNLNNNAITTFTFVVKVHVLPYSSYYSGCHLISLFGGAIFIANGQASLGSYGSANPKWTTEQDVYLKVEKTSSLIALSWASDPTGTWTSILSNSYYLTSDLTGNWELGAVVDSFTTNAGISFDLANSYLEIDSAEVWKGYDATSTNKTISVNSNYLKNNAKYAKSVVIGEATNSTYGYSVAVGYGSNVGGYAASAFGSYARVYGQGSVQLGEGTNNTANCLQFKNTPIIVNGVLAPALVTQVKNATTIVVEDYTV